MKVNAGWGRHPAHRGCTWAGRSGTPSHVRRNATSSYLTSAVALLLVIALAFSPAAAADALHFQVQLDKKVADAGVTGRLFVFLSQRRDRDPRFGPNWFSPEPFFGLEVQQFEPGQTRRVDDAADGFPDKLSKLPPGKYRVQAVLDHDFYEPHPANGVGNLYSEPVAATLDPANPRGVEISLTRVVKAKQFPQSKWVQELLFTSELLSKFHKRKVVDRCGVVLPAAYDEQPERRYPVIYEIPGFSGDHVPPASFAKGAPPAAKGEVDFIRVFLSGRCKWGHHVYADSATNGPRGESLVKELIPRIDEKFRTIPQPAARFVTGHSSGGWSSLWLQVTYPDVFGGVWSTSPDPVDFRDYQQVNLYADPPLSLYFDEAGNRRPIARRVRREGAKIVAQPVLWYDSFGRMDDCLARGGQLRSFEAVFSPRGDDGLPRRLWNRKTGRIDPEVAQAWQQYDIRLKLQHNWPALAPKLKGRLHIITGELDTFYLEGAVKRLAGTLKELGSDAVVEIVPGKDHGSVLTADLLRRIRREMSEAFLKSDGTAGAARP
jgi:pimeloyl-ACP methyl ester carboxylesterase